MAGLLDTQETIPSAKEIAANTQIAIKNYGLGAVDPEAANTKFWQEKAKTFGVTVDEAKRRRCANCEYYNNTPEMMKSMESIPLNQYDLYDGQPQRGYCVKLDFICHTSRLCDVWDRKEFQQPDIVEAD